MRGLTRGEVPVAMEGDGVEVRLGEVGEMTVGFFTIPKGMDLRPLLEGQPDDLCQCPHYGYMLKGRVRMHTGEGHKDFEAGQAYYWGPGHAPEALEDAEFVEFSPTAEFSRVFEHVKARAAAAG